MIFCEQNQPHLKGAIFNPERSQNILDDGCVTFGDGGLRKGQGINVLVGHRTMVCDYW